MKNWEDIVKDRLEGYESALPEGGLAEFRARRDAGAAPRRKPYPLVWALAATVAAGLAAVLLFRQSAAPEDALQVVAQQPVAEVLTNSTPVLPEEASVAPEEFAAASQETAAPAERPAAPVKYAIASKPESVAPDTQVTPAGSQTAEPQEQPAAPEEQSAAPEEQPATPFIPESVKPRKVDLKMNPAAGSLLGAGLLATLATAIRIGYDSGTFGSSGYAADAGKYFAGWPDTHSSFAQYDNNKITGYTHYIPLKLGLSARLPVTERLSITSGLDYSSYTSKISFYSSGEKTQKARYLGVPLRLDWTLASGKLFDAYIGAGFEADFCVGAKLDGKRVTRDGVSLALIGAGGVQYNITERLGLYLEPQLSWSALPGKRVLETYRSPESVNFTLATGLRITLK